MQSSPLQDPSSTETIKYGLNILAPMAPTTSPEFQISKFINPCRRTPVIAIRGAPPTLSLNSDSFLAREALRAY
jgi:hypothetical protein